MPFMNGHEKGRALYWALNHFYTKLIQRLGKVQDDGNVQPDRRRRALMSLFSEVNCYNSGIAPKSMIAAFLFCIAGP